METSFSNLHVAILSSPGMGHFIPALLIGNRLAAVHTVKVTLLLITNKVSPPESRLFKLPTMHKLLDITEIPPVDISQLINPSTKVVIKLRYMVREALPLIRSTIATMERRPDALFVDHFCTEAVSIASEFNISKYVYVPTTAWFTALVIYCPFLDKETVGQYVDQKEDLRIPGCKPVRPEDVVDSMLDRDAPQYYEQLKQGERMPLFDGILMNTWEELEITTLQAFRENEILRSVVNVPVYPIGPLVRPAEPIASSKSTDGLIIWLDRQPNQSVLFVSFGSGGLLSAEQIMELAWGLELSQQRFIWVVRPPTTGSADDAFFSAKNNTSNGTPNYLPQGFLTRIKSRGMVVSTWAQQIEILNHPSVGGFLSHCGWNSILESITNGVPIIAWPLYAEQRLNATFLVEELGVAVRPQKLPTKQVVDREEIQEMVKTLMQEKERNAMRDKVKQLKISASNALNHNGSSHRSMCEVLSKISCCRKLV